MPLRDCQFLLANAYMRGYVVEQDLGEALRWYTLAANDGHPVAQTLAGICLQGKCKNEGDEAAGAKGVQWLALCSERGDREAMFYLGQAYLTGRGIAKDEYRGLHWIKRSAEKGDHAAAYQLAQFYRDGHLVLKDGVLSKKWYREAAKVGHLYAAFEMGMLCFDDFAGVDKNPQEGMRWLLAAANGGLPEAMRAAGLAYYSGDGIERNEGEAAKWLGFGAERGDAMSQFAYGLMMLHGKTDNDVKALLQVEAILWITKAAVCGGLEDAKRVANENRELFERLMPGVMDLCRNRAEEGDTQAQMILDSVKDVE